MKTIDELLEQAGRQLFVRASLFEEPAAAGIWRRFFKVHILTGFAKPINDCPWVELEYDASEIMLTGGEYTAGENGYRLLIHGVKDPEARAIMEGMTNRWQDLKINTQPFLFIDHTDNRFKPPENINAVLHLSVLFGIYCAQGYFNKYPELSLRLKALLYQSRNKLFDCLH
jgi:hypothetical protein